MKTKSILLFSTLMIIASSAWAQTTFGVRAGLNISNEKYSGDGGSLSGDAKVGISFGGFAQVALNDKFSLQPELNFSQMGAKLDGNSETLNYLAIPLAAKYHFNKFSLSAGPQFSFLLSAKDKAEGETFTVTDDFKTMELSGLFGGAYEINDNFSFNARYQFGLSNILKDSGDMKLKNSAFSFGIGYKF